MKFRFFAFLSLMMLLSGCQTNELKQYERLKVGMDKAEVLEIMGSPQKVSRRQSRDKWVYKFYHETKWYDREIQFSEGRAIYVGEPLPPDSDVELTPQQPIRKDPQFVPLE